VNVKFFYYAGTMQEACLRLMGKKLLISLAMEGKFASEGLQAIEEGDDILMAMARELVTEKGIGESAAVVWREIQKQQAEVLGVRTAETASVDAESVIDARPEEVGPPPGIAPLFTSGTAVTEASRRKAARRTFSAEDQLSLFGA